MSDDFEWLPWVRHDGGRPENWPSPEDWPKIHILMDAANGGITSGSAPVSPNDPRFFWRWHRVRTGWFRSAVRRICDDPAYAPIVQYRHGRPRRRSVALDRIAELVANPSLPINAPEGPKRVTVPQEGGAA